MELKTITEVVQHPLQPGFLGKGHMARAVLGGLGFAKTDPFIMLMDDQVDLPGGQPVGGPHPHAGFETVTLILQGNGKDWKTGSMEIMTAGKGIVHTEEISDPTSMHILQLWLVLPPSQRWAAPRLQQILLEDTPTLQTNGYEIRVYSGESNGLRSPIQNQTPFTLVDFNLQKEASVNQQLPAGYSGFVYVVDGNVALGNSTLRKGETGWFEAHSETTELIFQTTNGTARFVLYAGQPQQAPIVSYGPFIGDNQQDIGRLYKEYREGIMPHVNDLPDHRRTRYLKDGKTVPIEKHVTA